MSDIEQASLRYHAARACSEQWRDFLQVLAEELNQQMSADENRAFFYALGRKLAERMPLPEARNLEDLELHANERFAQTGWGFLKVRDAYSSLEFLHSCAPLRQAFGDAAMEWAGGLLEGLYASWVRQLGAGEELQLRQVGEPEGVTDTLCFRLAHPSLFL